MQKLIVLHHTTSKTEALNKTRNPINYQKSKKVARNQSKEPRLAGVLVCHSIFRFLQHFTQYYIKTYLRAYFQVYI